MNALAQMLLVLILCVTGLNANNSITGKITDDNGNGIYYSTILLYSVEDSCIVKLTTSDHNGNYILDDVEDGEYFIAATILSHQSSFSDNFSLPNESKIEIDLTLETMDIELPVIEVIAKRTQNEISSIVNPHNSDNIASTKDGSSEIVHNTKLNSSENEIKALAYEISNQ